MDGRGNARIIKENVTAYLFILPQLIFFGLFLVYPVIEGFRLSLFEVSFFDEVFCGLDNYRSLFADPIFYKAAANTLIMVFWTTIITVSAGFFYSSIYFRREA